jgi:MFS family permease
MVGRTDRERAAGTSVWMAASALALALGPLTGGFIVARWDWGVIFLINVPIGVAILLLGLLTLPRDIPRREETFDGAGAAGSMVLLFSLTYLLLEGPSHGWFGAGPATAAVLGILAAGFLVAVERRSSAPLLDRELFRSRPFTGGLAVQVLWGIGFNGVLFFASIFLQDVLLFSPTLAGAAFLPPAVVVAILAPLSFHSASRYGARATIGAGLVLMAAGMLLFTPLQRGDSYAALLPGVLLLGVGTALITPLTVAVLAAVPEHRNGIAGSFLSLGREVSGALGIAVIGAVIGTRLPAGSPASSPDAFRSALVLGLTLGAGLVLVGALISWRTLPGRTAAALGGAAPERSAELSASLSRS